MMIYLQKRVIDQNELSPSSTEKEEIRCGMTTQTQLAPQGPVWAPVPEEPDYLT